MAIDWTDDEDVIAGGMETFDAYVMTPAIPATGGHVILMPDSAGQVGTWRTFTMNARTPYAILAVLVAAAIAASTIIDIDFLEDEDTETRRKKRRRKRTQACVTTLFGIVLNASESVKSGWMSNRALRTEDRFQKFQRRQRSRQLNSSTSDR